MVLLEEKEKKQWHASFTTKIDGAAAARKKKAHGGRVQSPSMVELIETNRQLLSFTSSIASLRAFNPSTVLLTALILLHT